MGEQRASRSDGRGCEKLQGMVAERDAKIELLRPASRDLRAVLQKALEYGAAKENSEGSK
jgi:hypothetical protein